MSLFLTQDEVAELTGYKRKAKQCQQLRIMGVPYRTNARGEPIVTVQAINGTPPKQTEKTGWQPAGFVK
jgi:hypothetical protein